MPQPQNQINLGMGCSVSPTRHGSSDTPRTSREFKRMRFPLSYIISQSSRRWRPFPKLVAICLACSRYRHSAAVATCFYFDRAAFFLALALCSTDYVAKREAVVVCVCHVCLAPETKNVCQE